MSEILQVPICIICSLLSSLSADFTGIYETPEEKWEETLRRTREELQKSLEKNLFSPNAPVLKANILLTDAFVNLINKRNLFKRRKDEMESLFLQKLSAQRRKAEDHAMILKCQNEVLRSNTSLMKILEEHAFGVRLLICGL